MVYFSFRKWYSYFMARKNTKSLKNVVSRKGNAVQVTFERSNRDAVVASLAGYRAATFDDRREERGGAKNYARDILSLEEEYLDYEGV